MPVQRINGNINNQKTAQNNKVSKQQSFTGSFNPIVTVMDAIDRGGFAASFIAQDGIGMVAPRIYEGLNRNRKKDENGKKTGPLNWEFARREGIREVLSGPSAFLIPMGIMAFIKRLSGTGNNVHVNHIQALGDDFKLYAASNPEHLKDADLFRRGYYTQVFENALSNSTDKNLAGEELTKTAQRFADKLVESENLRKTDKKGANKLLSEITNEFVLLRKSNTSALNNELDTVIALKDGKQLNTNIRRLTQSLSDYTTDAFEKLTKHVKQGATVNIEEFVNKFNTHRIGTRVVSNLGMWGAVVGFYALIPKLYNLGLKHDPGLKGLETEHTAEVKTEQKGKDVSFSGNVFTSVGKAATKEGSVSRLLSEFEFNGASMPANAMLTLLFGFTLPARYSNAKSDKERKEIIVRDISSFTAILFAAKALARGFSKMFSKISGYALNITPEDHSKGLWNKFKNYFTTGEGINVLSSEQIVTKYSNIQDYKNGINGFFEFIQGNGGNIKKLLSSDKTLRQNADEILKKFGNTSLKDATIEQITKAFEKARKSETMPKALDNIYSAFSAKDNKFIFKAKTFNSAFGFASTLILVPAFMMWLARYCERMTKKAVAKEQAQKAALENKDAKILSQNVIFTSKPSMQKFLNN